MTNGNRLTDLREKTHCAMDLFKSTVKDIGQLEYEELEPYLIHDNVKIVEANDTPFEFEPDQKKQQVVVILRGKWILCHGSATRELEPSDSITVVKDSPFPTIFKTKDKGSKLVYAQFK